MNRWDEVRENYLNWISTTPLRQLFSKSFSWKGMSLWWETLPVQRDNISDPIWYDLLKKLCSDEGEFKHAPKRENRLFLFLRDIIRLLLIRLYFNTRGNQVNDSHICYHIIDYNLKKEDGIIVDRNYSTAPLKDIEFNHSSFYLLKVHPTLASFKNGMIKKRLEEYQDLNRPFWICDEYLKITDIILVHSLVFWFSVKLFFVLSFSRKKLLFQVENKSATSILLPLLQASFHGTLQASLLYAISMERFFNQFTKPQTIVTYCELLPEFKFVYYLVQRQGHKFINIQHSYGARNKLLQYYRRSEVSTCVPGDPLAFSPRPNFYLVQGQQFYNVLSEYFPAENIYIVGCLKYDNYLKILSEKETNKQKVLNQVGIDGRKILLVAFSVGDEDRIINILRDFTEFKNWRILISPHPTLRAITIKKINQISSLKERFEIFDDISTNELNLVADLVLGGYSVTIFESLIFGIPSLYACGINDIPYLDDNPFLTKCESVKDLNFIMDKIELNQDVMSILNMKNAVEEHFYKIDGRANQRLWSFINKFD